MYIGWEEDVKEWLQGVEYTADELESRVKTLRSQISWLKEMTTEVEEEEAEIKAEPEPDPAEVADAAALQKREFAMAGIGSSTEKSLRRQMRDAAIRLAEAYVNYWNEGTDKQYKKLDKTRRTYDEISKRWYYGQRP